LKPGEGRSSSLEFDPASRLAPRQRTEYSEWDPATCLGRTSGPRIQPLRLLPHCYGCSEVIACSRVITDKAFTPFAFHPTAVEQTPDNRQSAVRPLRFLPCCRIRPPFDGRAGGRRWRDGLATTATRLLQSFGRSAERRRWREWRLRRVHGSSLIR
jgi:hypothetical protein